MGYRIIYDDTLSHHGILGMKWGKRNGPPYPLDASDHSASEKKAGWRKSLNRSAEKKTGWRKIFSGSAGKQNITADPRKENTQNIKQKIEEKKASSDLTKLNSLNSEISQLSDELATDYDNYYKSIKNDPKFRKSVWSNLRKDFGVGVDDEDLFDWDKEELIEKVLQEYYPKELKAKTQRLMDANDEYFSELKTLTKDILDQYKDYPIDFSEGASINQSVLNGWFDSSSRFNSYLSRHFDDYWVNDVDSRYDVFSSFTFEEYNRRNKN